MLLEPVTGPGQKSRMARIAVLATVIAAFSLTSQWNIPRGTTVWGVFTVDNYSVFFQWLFLIIGAVSAFLSIRFNERESLNRGEYYALLLFACSGMSLMAASCDLILTFLGIEILSIATYILAGFKRSDELSNESSLKYFLLGSFATAILLYGIALIYGGTESTNYEAIRESMLQGSVQTTTLIGMGLLIVGFGFKVALVPFHSWVPDVYEGAPTPVTAFMAVGPKAAGFAALMRILVQAFPFLTVQWGQILWVLAILTMTLGNVVAVLQTNIKRMLAYSAIAHAGYILVGFVAGNDAGGFSAVLFYLVAYTVMNLLAFSVVLSFSREGDRNVYLADYAGLARKAPFAAAVLSLALISLAGIPLTCGFMGKFYLFSAAVKSNLIGLAIIGVLNSVVSVFYYFRVLIYMYMREAPEGASEPEAVSWPVRAIMALGALGILFIGIFPAPILELAVRSSFALK